MASVLQNFNRAVPIVKSDTVNFPGGICDAIYIGGAGITVVVMEDDSAVPFTCIAGQVLPVRAKRVNSTTTASTLWVALYQV